MENELNMETERPNYTPKESNLVKIWNVIFNGYFLIAFMIFTPYYNWQYAQEHGFVSWVLLGEIVPTAKAMAWPYFVFIQKSNKVQWTAEEKENLKHFTSTVSALKTASQLADESKEQILPVVRVALVEAQQVSDDVMMKLHPDLKEHFKNQLQKGLELMIKDFENGDKIKPETLTVLNQWNDWIGNNSKEIQSKLRE